MEEKMKIAIGNDHAATELKFVIMDYLKELGHEVTTLEPTERTAAIIRNTERKSAGQLWQARLTAAY